jgi:hypothetical protein
MNQIEIAKKVGRDFQWFHFPYKPYWLKLFGWYIKIPPWKKREADSRSRLINLGLKIIREATKDNPYYLCEFPEEWTLEEDDFVNILRNPEVGIYTTNPRCESVSQVLFFRNI